MHQLPYSGRGDDITLYTVQMLWDGDTGFLKILYFSRVSTWKGKDPWKL